MIRFLHVDMFFLLIPLVIFIVWNAIVSRRLKKKLIVLGSEAIQEFLMNRVLTKRIKLKNILFITTIFLLIIASSGPQIGESLSEVKRKGIDVIIALDISTSMNAQDIEGSTNQTRLNKSKRELSRLINKLQGNRVGIIIFAGSSHIHCPITSDYAAAKLFLNSIDTQMISEQGTDISSAISLALNNIEDDLSKYKLLVLVSDGEEHEQNALNLAEQASNRGIIIHTVGIGSTKSVPIPMGSGATKSYKKDKNNNIVTTKLNKDLLRDISEITNGIFVHLEKSHDTIDQLLLEIMAMDKRELDIQIYSHYEDRYQIFLIVSLIFLILDFLLPTRSNKEIVWEGRMLRNDY